MPARAGTVPSRSRGVQPRGNDWVSDPLSRQSLIVLKMLSDAQTGAMVAGAREYWAYCWPRDAAFCAAAFDLAGKPEEAERLYRFLARVQAPDGHWEARYWADGQPVRDGRPPQLDAPGLVAWGLWLHSVLAPDGAAFARAAYPTARRAAAAILQSLDPATGLPGPGLDANEAGPPALSASNAAAGYAGLRAAARLAEANGQAAEAARCRAAALRIRSGVGRFLWDPRRGRFLRAVRPESAGLDPFMLWLSWPFGMLPPNDPRVEATAAALRESRRLPSGFYRGLVRSVGSEAWLHQHGIIAAYLDAAGRRQEAGALSDLLARAATPFNTLPERLDPRTLRPTSTTPLAWSHAMQLLLSTRRAGRRLPLP
jgi:glucoamylase